MASPHHLTSSWHRICEQRSDSVLTPSALAAVIGSLFPEEKFREFPSEKFRGTSSLLGSFGWIPFIHLRVAQGIVYTSLWGRGFCLLLVMLERCCGAALVQDTVLAMHLEMVESDLEGLFLWGRDTCNPKVYHPTAPPLDLCHNVVKV